jgi:hypothetical protein
MKAQISIESLTTFGLIVAFTVPVLLLLLAVTQYGHEDAARAQAYITARVIAENIELIYFEGDGAKKTLLINLPSNTKGVSISGQAVVVNITTSAGLYEAAAPFYGNISRDSQNCSLRDVSGIVSLSLENNGGRVKISC